MIASTILYNGTMFDSELAASWAAFFDLQGIFYEYQPAVAFHDWQPDYAIATTTGYALAKVMPYLSIAQWRADIVTLTLVSASSPRPIF